MVTQSGIEMGHTKVSGGHSEWNRDGTHQGQWWSLRVDIEMGHTKSVVVTQSGIEMGQGLHTKVSSGHSEWNRDGTHQGQWWSLRVV